jgi:hypothetical protein
MLRPPPARRRGRERDELGTYACIQARVSSVTGAEDHVYDRAHDEAVVTSGTRRRPPSRPVAEGGGDVRRVPPADRRARESSGSFDVATRKYPVPITAPARTRSGDRAPPRCAPTRRISRHLRAGIAHRGYPYQNRCQREGSSCAWRLSGSLRSDSEINRGGMARRPEAVPPGYAPSYVPSRPRRAERSRIGPARARQPDWKEGFIHRNPERVMYASPCDAPYSAVDAVAPRHQRRVRRTGPRLVRAFSTRVRATPGQRSPTTWKPCCRRGPQARIWCGAQPFGYSPSRAGARSTAGRASRTARRLLPSSRSRVVTRRSTCRWSAKRRRRHVLADRPEG